MDSSDVEYIDSHLYVGEDYQEEGEEESFGSSPMVVPNYTDYMDPSAMSSCLLFPSQYTPDLQYNCYVSNPAPSVSQDNSLPPLYGTPTFFHDFSQYYSGLTPLSSLPLNDPLPVDNDISLLCPLQPESNSLQSHEISQNMDLEFIPESNQEEDKFLWLAQQNIRLSQLCNDRIQQITNNINTVRERSERIINLIEERRRNRPANLYVFYSTKKNFVVEQIMTSNSSVVLALPVPLPNRANNPPLISI